SRYPADLNLSIDDKISWHMMQAEAIETDFFGSWSRWEGAALHWSSMIELESGKATYRRRRARAFHFLGRLTEALADCDRAVALEPEDWQNWQERASVLSRLGRWEGVIADLTRALELNLDHWEARRDRGWAYASLRQWDKATTEFVKVLELKP